MKHMEETMKGIHEHIISDKPCCI